MTQPDIHDPLMLSDLAQELIAMLPGHAAGRTARTVMSGSTMRAVVIALAADHEMAEHEAPPAAVLQVLTGQVRLVAGDDSWTLAAGQLIPIPQQRHSVHADEDSAIMLTVALH
ncbi:cupin domain-containing protein [Nocardioides pacificus]